MTGTLLVSADRVVFGTFDSPAAYLRGSGGGKYHPGPSTITLNGWSREDRRISAVFRLAGD